MTQSSLAERIPEVEPMLAHQPAAGSPGSPLASADAFRDAMRRLSTGVTIIASENQGMRAGLTATAVCSLAATPPSLLVCVNRTVYAHSIIVASRVLSVNVLAAEQEDIAKRFAGMLPAVEGNDRFAGSPWQVIASGAPVLVGALANFDCRVTEVVDWATHSIFLCEVLAARSSDGSEALVYLNGRFNTLTTEH